MKKFGLFLTILMLSATISAQEKSSLTSRMAEKNILNHLDVGVNVGSMGIGFDLTMPIGDYVRVRTGYSFMPGFKIRSKFSVGTSNPSASKSVIQKFNDKKGRIDSWLAELENHKDHPKYEYFKGLLEDARDITLHDYISMEMKPNLHQFKLLVDVMPFKNNKHWTFTAGFLIGSPYVGSACNAEWESLPLRGLNAYNDIYKEICKQEFNLKPEWDNEIKKAGVAGFPLGEFANGDKAIMVPSADNTARGIMKISNFRPYLGCGYNTSLSKNEKWKLNVDAGVMFFCGKPKVYVNNVYRISKDFVFDDDNWQYDIVRPNEDMTDFVVDEPLQDVDLVNDLHNIPGKVGNLVNTISKFKVYPNISIGISYRLF